MIRDSKRRLAQTTNCHYPPYSAQYNAHTESDKSLSETRRKERGSGERALLVGDLSMYFAARHAFASHASQLVWDRYLYMVLSRYMSVFSSSPFTWQAHEQDANRLCTGPNHQCSDTYADRSPAHVPDCQTQARTWRAGDDTVEGAASVSRSNCWASPSADDLAGSRAKCPSLKRSASTAFSINNARTLDWQQAGKIEARLSMIYPLVRSTRPVKRQSIGKQQRCIYLNKGIKETCGSASEA